MLIRPATKELETIVEELESEVGSGDRDEMAIPTYLHKNPLIKWVFWKRHKKIIELSQLNKEKSVLDFGCGIGILLPTLSKYSGSVFATDLFPQFAKKLCEKRDLQNVAFIPSENLASEIPDESLDVIIAADVMEHLDEPGKQAEIFFKKLKKGGSLIVSGPTESKLYALGRKIAGFGGKGEYHHFNIYDLDKKIKENNFSKEIQKNIPFCFGPSLFKIIRYRK